MGIKDVGADTKGGSPIRNDLRLRTRKEDSSKEGTIGATEDFFEKSGRLGIVRALIDNLGQVPEVRSDVVEQARAKLASGELDTPESAASAARAFLEGSR